MSAAKWIVPLGILVAGLALCALLIALREPVEREAPAPETPLVRVMAASSSRRAAAAHRAADYEVALERARAGLARADQRAHRARKERERQQRPRRAVDRQRLAARRRGERGERVTAAAARGAAALAQAERDLARTELRAPFAGRVREEQVDVGQFVSRGAPVAKLYAVDYAEVRLPIRDEDLAWIDVPRASGGERGGPAGGAAGALRRRGARVARPRRAHRGRDRSAQPHGARGGARRGPLRPPPRRDGVAAAGRPVRRGRDPRPDRPNAWWCCRAARCAPTTACWWSTPRTGCASATSPSCVATATRC
jgi:biotin carboxyl carrier protein